MTSWDMYGDRFDWIQWENDGKWGYHQSCGYCMGYDIMERYDQHYYI